MPDSTYLQTSIQSCVSIARITTEKMGGFEAPALTTELIALVESQPWPIVVDLSAVQILGSQGIGVLLNLRKACEGKQRKIALTGVSDEIMTMLKISALTKLFSFKSTVDDAIKAIK
jgi:anti-sigma B factor antagonist